MHGDVGTINPQTGENAVVSVAYFGIANPDHGVFVLVVPLALIVALIAAQVFAKQTAPTPAEGVA